MIIRTKIDPVAGAILMKDQSQPVIVVSSTKDFGDACADSGGILLYSEEQVLQLEEQIQNLQAELSAARINNPTGLGQH